MPKVRDIDQVRQKWVALHQRRSDSAAKTAIVTEKESLDLPLFSYFMARRQLELQLEFEKKQLLVTALEQADWSAPIFSDSEIEKITLCCFKEGNITYQQFITIIDRQQHQLDFPGETLQTYPLINEDGSYTDYATTTFLPLLKSSLHLRNRFIFTEEHSEYLRLLIATLPRSEQIVYTIHVNIHTLSKPSLSFNAPEIEDDVGTPLTLTLEALGILLTTTTQRDAKGFPTEKFLTSLSTGLKDSIMVACYGLKRCVPPIYRLDSITPREIEEGVMNDFRPASIMLKDDSLIEGIHRSKFPHRFVTTLHDNYHSESMSQTPTHYRKAFLYMVNLARLELNTLHEMENRKRVIPEKNLMTYGTWSFIDRGFNFSESALNFFKEHEKTEKRGEPKEYNEKELETHTDSLCLSLIMSYTNECGLLNRNRQVSVFGMIVFVDMLRNPEKWKKEFGIMPKYLTCGIKEGYDYIEKISTYDPQFITDSSKMQALKLQLFQQLNVTEKSPEDIAAFFKQIQIYCSENGGIDRIGEFKRVSRKEGSIPGAPLLANQVYLQIDPRHQEMFNAMKELFELGNPAPQRSRCVGTCTIL